MRVIRRVRDHVESGLVLSEQGRWVPRDTQLAKRRELLRHLENGEVFYKQQWTPLWRARGNLDKPRIASTHTDAICAERRPEDRMSSFRPARSQRPEQQRFSAQGVLDAEIVEESHGLARVRISGYVDQRYEALIVQSFERLLKSDVRAVIIDAAGAVHISSAVWGALAGQEMRYRKRGGGFALIHLPSTIRRSFAMMRLEKVLPCFESAADARRHLSHIRAAHTKEPVQSPFCVSEISSSASLAILPIEERVRRIIGDYGALGLLQIRKKLRDPEYGGTSTGIVSLIKILKNLNLDTKKKRHRYFRSA